MSDQVTSDRAVQRARALFESGFACSESVLVALAESQGIESDVIPRIATPFGSGLAGTCSMCGALSGAVMGIGLVAGRQRSDQPRDAAYAITNRLLAAFAERFGSTNCRQLIDIDLGAPGGREEFHARNLLPQGIGYAEACVQMALAFAAEQEDAAS